MSRAFVTIVRPRRGCGRTIASYPERSVPFETNHSLPPQWQAGLARDRDRSITPLGPADRSRDDRNEVRLRRGNLRLVHGRSERRGCPLVRCELFHGFRDPLLKLPAEDDTVRPGAGGCGIQVGSAGDPQAPDPNPRVLRSHGRDPQTGRPADRAAGAGGVRRRLTGRGLSVVIEGLDSGDATPYSGVTGGSSRLLHLQHLAPGGQSQL